MNKRIIIIISAGLILTAGIIFAASRPEISSPPVVIEEAVMMMEEAALMEEIPEEVPEAPAPSRAERTVRILAEAYPRHITEVEFRNEDWAFLMNGVWYYYSGGRMLPERYRERANEYSGSFNVPGYQKDLPVWVDPTPEQSDRYRGVRNNNTSSNNNTRTNSNSGNTQRQQQPRVQRQRQYFFHEGLWRASSRDEASRHMSTIRFLNFRVTVHSDLVDTLSVIERRIMSMAETDSEVRSWVNGIGEMHGWNWRAVAGSASRSYHSYGIAIDILPKNLQGKETYWQWAASRGREWWAIPYTDRYHPPDKVVKTFESFGFMWGGKWARFDTMHFEYRPEVLLTAGLPVETVR